VIARRHRKTGEEVFFSTGTDEHGQKMQRCAAKVNKSPQGFVDEMSIKFTGLWEKLNISYDNFIRTTQPQHMRVAQDIFQKIYEKGDIYKGEYEGLYCVDCEAFYTEKDLSAGLCPVHGKLVERIKEESYFFRMSKYQEMIFRHIQDNKDFILPAARRNEVLNRIKDGIRDLSVSRSSFNWGIPLPIDKRHVIFVWFDALLNYISVLGYPGENFKKYWPADIHLIGKDILWFHAVVWSAILMAADIELPRKIFVHGFVNLKGEKISKSKGITVNPAELADKYGADALRYFLMREIPFGEDGNFSESALIKRINSDLADDLGNLVYRTLTMIERYFAGHIPVVNISDRNWRQKLEGFLAEADVCMSGLEFNLALDKIWEVINMANKYIEDTKPWNLAKEKKEGKLKEFILCLVDVIREVANCIYPFMPQTSESIIEQLGRDKVKKGKPLFPRIETKA
jgi:methionyl-tRNA synthetase